MESANYDLDFLTSAVSEEERPGTPSTLSFDDVYLEQPYRTRCNTWPRLQMETDVSRPSESNREGVRKNLTMNLQSHLQCLGADPGYSPTSALGPLPQVTEEEPSGLADETAIQQSAPNTRPIVKKYITGSGCGGSRRNPWGALSYADLITQAIKSSPEQRLTLSQIYDWLIKNFKYFGEKSDSMNSIGWKNSIRHNLSLHSKFVRVQNEGSGKSSWWTLDLDHGTNSNAATNNNGNLNNSALSSPPKKGQDSPNSSTKTARRRANTLDSTSKITDRRKQLKSRRRVAGAALEKTASSSSLNTSPYFSSDPFQRPRASSNTSSVGEYQRQRHPSSPNGGDGTPLYTPQTIPQASLKWTEPQPTFPSATQILKNFNEKLTLIDVDTSKDIIANELASDGGDSLDDFDFDASQLLVSTLPESTDSKNLKIKILEPRDEVTPCERFAVVNGGGPYLQPKEYNSYGLATGPAASSLNNGVGYLGAEEMYCHQQAVNGETQPDTMFLEVKSELEDILSFPEQQEQLLASTYGVKSCTNNNNSISFYSKNYYPYVPPTTTIATSSSSTFMYDV